MKNQDEAGSFEAVVPADEHGSSCLPVVAQAAVPAESCDLRARIDEASKAIRFATQERDRVDAIVSAAWQYWYDLQREREARKTHVGGNDGDMPHLPAQPTPESRP